MIETIRSKEIVDQNLSSEHEIEKKFFVEDRHYFDELARRAGQVSIQQLYLSRPMELGSLRLRHVPDADAPFVATHKSEGAITADGLVRLETSAPVSQEAFDYYSKGGYAQLHKTRSTLAPGVTFDRIEGYDEPIVEIEAIATNPEAYEFYQQHRAVLVERTGELDVDNEWIAHQLSDVEDAPERCGPDALKMSEEIIAFKEVLGIDKMVVTIGGRSGSGKSTVAEQLRLTLEASGTFPGGVALMGTDDYNRGLRWLTNHSGGEPWVNFDDAIVYDTQSMAKDVETLLAGQSVVRRSFNFETQEPVVTGSIPPADIVIVEGIHAGSRDFAGVRKRHYEIDTPLVESLGWDLDRLRRAHRANSSIDSPSARLAYQLEYAEPTYQSLEKPVNKRMWSESVRPLTGQPVSRTQAPRGLAGRR
jgi:molybdopterin-guanine dinucleotide biosynthesis protein